MAADGTWKIAIETPMGTRNTTLVLKTEGDALKGTQSEGSSSTEIRPPAMQAAAVPLHARLSELPTCTL